MQSIDPVISIRFGCVLVVVLGCHSQWMYCPCCPCCPPPIVVHHTALQKLLEAALEALDSPSLVGEPTMPEDAPPGEGAGTAASNGIYMGA